ncbi:MULTISPECIES: hypothetical protein [unclassified Bradyrhizobium]|uniref:hypothetical protein n=1 Tax=unclassified Bradyrhizobium TaxID=2631580 RepID=UPI002916648D|nr:MULTISPECIES: hypothetical protein [unclassified Bradyrhizobium]
MTALISISDLTTVEDEPRVKDVCIGEHLGMAQPLNIRATIEANRAELEGFGPIHAARELVVHGSGAQREITIYYLNEQQALLLCMFSRTAKAAEVRKALIEVFIAWRRGQTADPSQTRIDARYALALAEAITHCEGDEIVLGPTDRELCAHALRECVLWEARPKPLPGSRRLPQRFTERLARKISEAGEGGIQRTVLMTTMNCDAASLDSALAPLIEVGAIILRRASPGAEPGRPSTRYYSR